MLQTLQVVPTSDQLKNSKEWFHVHVYVYFRERRRNRKKYLKLTERTCGILHHDNYFLRMFQLRD